jgi:hypothetical protein
MFSGLLVATGIGCAMYLGWHEADALMVFPLALILYIPALQSNREKAVTANNTFRMKITPMTALNALIQSIIVPYGSALLTVSILFFVAQWIS